jgi:hypothetical protein
VLIDGSLIQVRETQSTFFRSFNETLSVVAMHVNKLARLADSLG